MKKHTKIYYQFFDYGLQDFVPCEISGLKAVDIHHIHARGMGGSKKDKNDIQNLMAVTRIVHVVFGDKSDYMEFLEKAHDNFILTGEPYVKENPHHKAFDELLKYDEYKKIIEWNRRISQ